MTGVVIQTWQETAGTIASPRMTGQRTPAITTAAPHPGGITLQIWQEIAGTIASFRITEQPTIAVTTGAPMVTQVGGIPLQQGLIRRPVPTDSQHKEPRTRHGRA